MSFVGEIVTALSSNVAFDALMTGGIYDADDTSDQKITSKQYPDVFDSNLEFKPSCFVTGRTTDVIKGVDESTGYVYLKQFVEVYLYDGRYNGFTTLETAKQSVFNLLHQYRSDVVKRVEWQGERRKRNEVYQYSPYICIMFIVTGVREHST